MVVAAQLIIRHGNGRPIVQRAKMPEHKMASAAQQQQSLASGAAFGEYITKQRDVAPLFPRS